VPVSATRRAGFRDSPSRKRRLGVVGVRHHRRVDSTRVDRWLWAVRLTKTRPDAAAACRAGHVRVNDRPAKPATTVAPGDEIRARIHDTTRIVEVVRVIQRRVGAADAVTCYLDRTPKPEPVDPVARRDRGAGRPTKRERRVLDAFRTGRL
jgi:ribosome-associated heat shock protein Hsp15